MGSKDQYIKTLFQEETETLTQHGLKFSVPPETKTTELHADGLLSVVSREPLEKLPAPWSLVSGDEVLLEFKMQGDKTGRPQLERALLRRQAWQSDYSERHPDDPQQIPLWLVSGQLPSWVRSERLLREEAPGCFRLEPGFSRFYFIAANELPLRLELLPFLVARSGKSLVDLVSWLKRTRVSALLPLLKGVNMDKAQFQEVVEELNAPDLQEQLRRERIFLEILAKGSFFQEEILPPWQEKARQEGTEAGRVEVFAKQFSKRLKRELTEEEKTSLVAKLGALGADRLSDVLLDSPVSELSPWLLNPEAR